MKMQFTDAEKLEVIEHFIEQYRPVRTEPVYLVLKAIADDIRARDKTTDTIERFERALRNAAARKTALGYEMGNLREIAELTIGRWPTIKQALEQFEAGT